LCGCIFVLIDLKRTSIVDRGVGVSENMGAL